MKAITRRDMVEIRRDKLYFLLWPWLKTLPEAFEPTRPLDLEKTPEEILPKPYSVNDKAHQITRNV